MTETTTPKGTCPDCGKVVDLVDYDMDPDLAMYEEEYFSCADHNIADGKACEGSGKSPTRIYRPQDDEDWSENDDPGDDIDPGFHEQRYGWT